MGGRDRQGGGDQGGGSEPLAAAELPKIARGNSGRFCIGGLVTPIAARWSSMDVDSGGALKCGCMGDVTREE